MPNKIVTIKNTFGLHLRAASALVKLAHKYKAEICLKKDNMQANGKSVLGIATLGAPVGSELEICTEGPDAEELLDAIVQLVERKFDEEE